MLASPSARGHCKAHLMWPGALQADDTCYMFLFEAQAINYCSETRAGPCPMLSRGTCSWQCQQSLLPLQQWTSNPGRATELNIQRDLEDQIQNHHKNARGGTTNAMFLALPSKDRYGSRLFHFPMADALFGLLWKLCHLTTASVPAEILVRIEMDDRQHVKWDLLPGRQVWFQFPGMFPLKQSAGVP